MTTPYAPVPTPPTPSTPVVTPVATVPGAPTIGAATASGATTATVAFTAPASDGGVTITAYTANSTPVGGTGTFSGAGSGTMNVTGLTAGTSYTFTVTATNSVGTSAASAASAAVTLKTCATGGVCTVGDIGPGTGLVFYDAGSVQAWGQYLEVARKDWGGNETAGIKWCNVNTPIPGSRGTAIGTGSSNTAAMLAFPCSSSAANAAFAYRGGEKDDWFLPSIDELVATHPFQSSAIYGLGAGYYWSSSENGDNDVELINSSGATYQDQKDNPNRVRPVRAF